VEEITTRIAVHRMRESPMDGLTIRLNARLAEADLLARVFVWAVQISRR
jgi:hypothetical protein